MYLKQLDIVGFKSFADKTKLTFDPGLIAIVGPNGCGKSNVSDAILSSKPEDRRGVFEEAAGITKFKADRKEALRKIEQTEQNLLREADVLKEMKRQIGSLQRQVGKAKRYKELHAQVHELEERLQSLASRYGRYCCSAMPADYAYKAFVWAQKYLPESATLSINDFHMTDTYVAQVKDLRANGAYVEMVGSQMHLMNPKSSAEIAKGRMSENMQPGGVAKRFRMLSRAGLPIHLSEITITAPDTTKRGEMVQAIIMRNLYRAWFSVKMMDGITWWNVVDNCGLPGEPSLSGLFTRDMKPKIAYYAMDDLINREWTTKATVKAKDGKVAFRGFHGRYRLTWKAPDGTIKETFAEVTQ